jgi:hypothetical protein
MFFSNLVIGFLTLSLLMIASGWIIDRLSLANRPPRAGSAADDAYAHGRTARASRGDHACVEILRSVRAG